MRFSSPWPRTRVQVHGPTVAWVASESRALMTVLPLLTQPDSSSHSRHLPRRLSPLRSFSFFSPLSPPRRIPRLLSPHLSSPRFLRPSSFLLALPRPPFIPAATRPFPPPALGSLRLPLLLLPSPLSRTLTTLLCHRVAPHVQVFGVGCLHPQTASLVAGFCCRGVLCGGSCSTICFYPQIFQVLHTLRFRGFQLSTSPARSRVLFRDWSSLNVSPPL